MAVTEFQRVVCRLLAEVRIADDESYVAGGVALNALLDAPRLSRDIDIFHGTASALQESWLNDRRLLESSGYRVDVLREHPWLVEARVSRATEAVLIQWARDSSYRFFPLLEHEDFGLVLHPFDLATNKVLALVGRLEPRDWIDVIECDTRLQPLGYLAWAASGKDPGFSPRGILTEAARSSRYSREEIEALDFDRDRPDAAALSQRWRGILHTAEQVVDALPADKVGCCVLNREGGLYRGNPSELAAALRDETLQFHPGSIRGSMPRVCGG